MRPNLLYVTESGVHCGDCAETLRLASLGGESSDGITRCLACGRPGHRGSLLKVHGKYDVTTEKQTLSLMYRGNATGERLWFTGIADSPGMEFFLADEEIRDMEDRP